MDKKNLLQPPPFADSRQYKSELFERIFSNPNAFRDLIEGLTGIQLSTQLIRVDKKGMFSEQHFHHDIAFIDNNNHLFVLTEHQSSYDKNMAFRCFLYFADFLKHTKKKLPKQHGVTHCPEPTFFMLCNGEAVPKESVIKHQTLYPHSTKSAGDMYDVLIFDIHFNKLPMQVKMEKHRPLTGYARFIDEAERLRKKKNNHYMQNALFNCQQEGFMLQSELVKEVHAVSTMEERYEQAAKEWVKKVVQQEVKAEVQKETLQIAKNFLASGTDIEIVSKATDIPAEKLRELIPQ